MNDIKINQLYIFKIKNYFILLIFKYISHK